MKEYLFGAAAHSDVSHKCALPSCGFRGQQLVEVRRLGRQEVHREGDLREEVRPGCCGGGKCNLQ